jgi:hypothetical protein
MVILAEEQNSAQPDAEWFKQMIYEKRTRQEQRDARSPAISREKQHLIQHNIKCLEQMVHEKRARQERFDVRFSRWFGHLLIKTGKRMMQHAS